MNLFQERDLSLPGQRVAQNCDIDGRGILALLQIRISPEAFNLKPQNP